MKSSTRFVTIVLAAGAAVLLLAMAIGERMGTRVIGQATEQTLQSVSPQAVTPAPDAMSATAKFSELCTIVIRCSKWKGIAGIGSIRASARDT